MKRPNKKIKLAIISRRFPPDMFGGCEEVIYNIWKIVRHSYEVVLIIGWRDNYEDLPKSAYKIRLRNKNRLFDYVKFYFFCRNILKKEKPDLALINIFETPLKCIPSINILHDLSYGSRFRLYSKFKKLIAKMRLKKANKIIAVSNRTKEGVIKLGICSEKVKVVYSGIDYEKFKPIAKDSGRFTVTYPGRITEAKGQHIAIEAMKMIPQEILDKLELILVGFVDDAKYLLKLKKLSNGLPIRIEPNVPQIEKYYQKADVVIFPTLMQEGFGFTALEAMACSKPVIYSDLPAIKEATGDIGIKIKPGNSKELAHQIHRLYLNKDLRENLAKKGMEYVKSHYDWNKSFEEYQKIFKEVLDNNKQR